MHEQEKRCGGPYNQTSRNYAGSHPSSVASTFRLFNSAQSRFFIVEEPNVVDRHVKLPTACHTSFRLSLGNRSDSGPALRNYNDVINLDFLENFEVYVFACPGIRGRHIPC